MQDKLKYPIGKPNIPDSISELQKKEWIHTLEMFPNRLENLVKNLNEQQLDTTYRKDGWTIRQVIHHCADSHLNSYIRFKWALTEDTPIIKAYYEDKWADLFDSKSSLIQLSLNSLKSLHAKWVFLLKGLSETQLKRKFIHPENNKSITLEQNLGIYAWHCNHHFEHINLLLKSKNWI